MKTSRLIIFLLLILCLVFALASCDEDSSAEATGSGAAGSGSTSVETSATTAQQTIPYVSGSQGLSFASNGDGTCAVTGIGTCQDSRIRIPSHSPNGDRVVSIADRAFENANNLTGVTIPGSVDEIGFSSVHSLYIILGIVTLSIVLSLLFPKKQAEVKN